MTLVAVDTAGGVFSPQSHTYTLFLFFFFSFCSWNWTGVYRHLHNFTSVITLYLTEATWGLMVSALVLGEIVQRAARSLKGLIFVPTAHLCRGVSEQDAEPLLASWLQRKGWAQRDPFATEKQMNVLSEVKRCSRIKLYRIPLYCHQHTHVSQQDVDLHVDQAFIILQDQAWGKHQHNIICVSRSQVSTRAHTPHSITSIKKPAFNQLIFRYRFTSITKNNFVFTVSENYILKNLLSYVLTHH